MIPSGNLDRRIELQQRTQAGTDTYNEPLWTWSTLATVWAQVVPLAGQELWDAQQVNARIDTRFRIRFREDLDETMRVAYQGRYYDIERIAEVGHREGLDLYGSAYPVRSEA